MSIKKVVWSPVEEEYLLKNQNRPIDQLCIALAKSRYAIKKKLTELDPKKIKKTKQKKSAVPKTKIGKRKDLGIFVRSGWEANAVRFFNGQTDIKLVEYEPYTFSFTSFGHLHGTVSYTPDLKVNTTDGKYFWIEVKGGWLRSQDKTKLRRFKKYYPEEFKKLCAVTPGQKSKTYQFFKELGVKNIWIYPELNKQCRKVIPHWE